MPAVANITQDDGWYKGTDKKLRYSIFSDDAQTTPLDVSTFALSWQLSSKPGQAPTLTKTLGSGITVTGVFNASPSLNTQVVEVAIADTDTDALAATTWWHELKRTDAGLEEVLAHGYARLLQPVHLS